MPTTSFKDLIVWQRGIQLTKAVYQCTAKLPREELYGLFSQMRRSAVSIPSNIAEGHRRGSKKDFTQFLRISDGSAAELETQLLLAHDIYRIDTKIADQLLVEVQKMLMSMIKKLNVTG